jgi:hypothetical protein
MSEMNGSKSSKLFVALATIFILLSVIGETVPAGASPAVGTVQKTSGPTSIVRQGQTISASVGQEIFENDILQTGRDGSMGVVFRDDTLLSLGPESLLVVDQYVFAPRQGKFSIVLKMLRGTAAYLSGLISKLAPESAHFETPSASIGIRGTHFVVKVEEK